MLTTRMLAADFHCSHTTIEKILHKCGKCVRHGKWVPHELSPANKRQRVEVSTSLLARQQARPFLDQIVTCDEKWIMFFNPAHSNQWLSPGQASVPTPKPDWGQQRVMLCVWWYCGGVIHWELVERGRTINAELYSAQLDRVQAKLRSPGLSMLSRRGVIFQQDNARPHVAQRTLQKIEELG